MTTSDKTALRPGATERLAKRVGTSLDGCVPDAGKTQKKSGGPSATVGLVCAKFNGGITVQLLDGALDALGQCGLLPEQVTIVWVPGAFEIPLAAKKLAESGMFQTVIALGAVIRGDTPHFDFVAGECAAGLQRAALDTGVPMVFGVLTTDTVEQALERAGEGEGNKGREAAQTALAMADIARKLDTLKTAESVTRARRVRS